VLLGRESGLWLEPVREVGYSARDRPFLYDLRDDWSDGEVELFAMANRGGEATEDFPGKLVAELSDAEGVDAEVLGGGARYSVLVEAWGYSRLACRNFCQQSFAGVMVAAAVISGGSIFGGFKLRNLHVSLLKIAFRGQICKE